MNNEFPHTESEVEAIKRLFTRYPCCEIDGYNNEWFLLVGDDRYSLGIDNSAWSPKWPQI